jgi:hypothetical protein
MVGRRWLLTSIQGHSVPQQDTRMLIGSCFSEKRSIMNTSEKYRAALSLVSKFADHLSECGQLEFDKGMSFLRKALDKFEKGEDCILVEEADSLDVEGALPQVLETDFVGVSPDDSPDDTGALHHLEVLDNPEEVVTSLNDITEETTINIGPDPVSADCNFSTCSRGTHW